MTPLFLFSHVFQVFHFIFIFPIFVFLENCVSSLVKIRLLGRWTRWAGVLGKAHLRVTPLSCFHLFHFLFVLGNNCFLRSLCAMEMWCPDDIGRDSWDWVGPPAWVRACFNSPEWGEGSSPVKKEPLQIVLLMLLLLFQ